MVIRIYKNKYEHTNITKDFSTIQYEKVNNREFDNRVNITNRIIKINIYL